METLSLQRNLKLIDEYLKSLNLPAIKVTNEHYSLKFSSIEKEKIFENMNLLTPEQRRDYLFIKIFLEGFINLESEREFLDISRSTINRDFNLVREELEDFKISVTYLHSKGLSISERKSEINLVFWKKLLKFLLQDEFLPKKIIDYLVSLFPMDKIKFLSIFNSIFKENKLNYGDFGFFIFLSYAIAFEQVENFSILELDKKIDNKYRMLEEFDELVSNVSKSGLIPSNLKFFEYTAEFIIELKSNKIYTDEVLLFSQDLYIFFKECFMIQSEIPPVLKDILFKKLNVAIFKASLNIIEINYWTFSDQDKIIIDLFNNTLKKINVSLPYSTLTTLLPVIKQILINEVIHENFNILVLLSDIRLLDLEELEQRFKFISKNITPFFEPQIYYKYAVAKDEVQKFQMIISDFCFTSLSNNKFFKVKNFLNSGFEENIKDYCISIHLEKLEKRGA